MQQFRILTALAGCTALAAAAIVVGTAAADIAPDSVVGNSGGVKADRIPVDDTAPDNQPHVGCSFGLDFSGYGKGELDATVTFAVQPPTGLWETLLTDNVLVGGDAAGGATDHDAARTYVLDLSSYEPHPEQGHHVKVSVEVTGVQGHGAKHKVFWVTGCEAPTPTPSPTPTPDPTDVIPS
jgi:hypothetical protein